MSLKLRRQAPYQGVLTCTDSIIRQRRTQGPSKNLNN
jgi:hypothetical protein